MSISILFGNASEAAVRLLISIVLGLPIALLHRYFLYGRCPTYQHVFFATCGILLCLWNYGLDTIHSVVTVCITYGILKLFGNSSLLILLTFIFNMVYLLCGYYATSTESYDIKWTMPQCILTLRLIGLAFDLADGKKPKEKLSASQKKVALNKLPTFLEITAFTYFPGACLVGPQFSLKRYIDFVQGIHMTDNIDVKSKNVAIQYPDCLYPGIFRMCNGLIYLILYQFGTQYISDQYMLSSEFEEQTFLKRLLLIGFWGHFNLYKYVCCWLFAEGVCMTFGLTYNGRDEKGRPLWNGCENVKLLTFETATQFNEYIKSFNINTNKWCAEYIYKRLKFLGSKLYSQFLTLLFLAIWHGFHSGYYVCFFLEYIIMFAETDLTQILERCETLQTLLKESFKFRILSWILMRIFTFTLMGYSLACFILLTFSRYHQVYSSVYYYGHIIYLSYPVISILLKKFVFKKRSKKYE